MISTLWIKVWHDVWANRLRAALVVLSLMVGIFAVGLTGGSRVILQREMNRSLQAVSPSDFFISVEHFNQAALQSLSGTEGVQRVETRALMNTQVRGENGQLLNLTLYALPDDGYFEMDRLLPYAGQSLPALGELVLERGALDYLGAQVGDVLTLQTSIGTEFQLPVSGAVHDPYQISPSILANAAGYIRHATLLTLGGDPAPRELHIRLTPAAATSPTVSEPRVRLTLERHGVQVFRILVTQGGQHPLSALVGAVLVVLGLMGLLALLLSLVLMVNTINALLSEHKRQIGLLKALGGRQNQILGMYLGLVGLLSLAALALAIPLSGLGARVFCGVLAGILNFDVLDASIPSTVIGLQIALGSLVPLLASLPAILSSVRRTAHQLLNDYGLSLEPSQPDLLDALLSRLQGANTLFNLATRNTFRRRGRLALTLGTLTLVSAIAISVLSVQAATRQSLADIQGVFKHDVDLILQGYYPAAQVEAIARQMDRVSAVESWQVSGVFLQRAGITSQMITLWGVPADTVMLRPTLIAGRWLAETDERAIVVDSYLLRDYPDIRPGDHLTLAVRGKSIVFQVVGVIASVPNAVPSGYFAYARFSDLAEALEQPGNVSRLMLQTTDHSLQGQTESAAAVSQQLKTHGFAVNGTVTGQQLAQSFASVFNILFMVLLVMAALMALVGALGLMGALSLNVLERQREIALLRALGARRWTIRQVLLIEGLLISLLAWLLGAVIAIPLSGALNAIAGIAFLQIPFPPVYSLPGVAIWLAASILLSVMASMLPARRAEQAVVAIALTYG